MTSKKSDQSEDRARFIAKFKVLSKEEKIELISCLTSELKKQHDLSEQDIIGKREAAIPIGIFSNDILSSLEAIVKYLKEELKFRFVKIGRLLNRSGKTIWATYHNASSKMPTSFGFIQKDIMIPVSAISDRSYSTLESVVAFIKDLDYTNHEVAEMLHLDDRTIWTVYDRVKKKREMKM